MNKIQNYADILGVKVDELNEFNVTDTFNNNEIGGVICHRSDYRYGAMIIDIVNGKEVAPQIIYGTPKIEYPFDRNGTYKWPEINRLEIFEKLDGTNILAYSYYDSNGKAFFTFKTRLTPCLKQSKFGDFIHLWLEVMDKNKWIPEIISRNGTVYNLSFELFGYKNMITILYDCPIDVRILFGIDKKNHNIIPPTLLSDIDYNYYPKSTIYPQNILPTDIYTEWRDKLGEENRETLKTEGVVLYARTDIGWRMFKCKPEQIEKLHWAAGGISKNALYTTAINLFENNDSPTIDDFITLLKEEYEDKYILRASTVMERILYKASVYMMFRKRVNEVYDEAVKRGFNIFEDKRAALRFVSQYFKKEEMKKVGTIVLERLNVR